MTQALSCAGPAQAGALQEVRLGIAGDDMAAQRIVAFVLPGVKAPGFSMDNPAWPMDGHRTPQEPADSRPSHLVRPVA